jgi:hypothetical protein
LPDATGQINPRHRISMNQVDRSNPGRPHHRQMTVAHIREQNEGDFWEVVFLESARFYRLSRKHQAFDSTVQRLREAMKSGRKLDIVLPAPDSDLIEEVLSL